MKKMEKTLTHLTEVNLLCLSPDASLLNLNSVLSLNSRKKCRGVAHVVWKACRKYFNVESVLTTTPHLPKIHRRSYQLFEDFSCPLQGPACGWDGGRREAGVRVENQQLDQEK